MAHGPLVMILYSVKSILWLSDFILDTVYEVLVRVKLSFLSYFIILC